MERLSFDSFSGKPFPAEGGTQIDEGDLRYGGPFPVFLSDPSIRRAIKRADELYSDRHGGTAFL